MKLVLVVFSFAFIFASSMPPMPPGFGAPSTAKADTRSVKDKKTNDFQKKISEIPSCNSLPPMIIFLPPPMEKDLVICRNEYYKPSKEKASKLLSKLLGKKVKIKSISVEDGFREVYKIEYSAKNLFLNKDFTTYCNSSLTKCLK